MTVKGAGGDLSTYTATVRSQLTFWTVSIETSPSNWLNSLINFWFDWCYNLWSSPIADYKILCQPMRMLSHWALFVSTNQMTLSSELWSKLSETKCRKWICCTVCSLLYICFEIIRICLFRQSSSTAPARPDTYTSQIIWFILTTNYHPLFVRRLYGGYFSPVTTCQ